jgi:hypothetical protein
MQVCIAYYKINRVERKGAMDMTIITGQKVWLATPCIEARTAAALACATAQGTILASSGLALHRRLF